MCEQSLESLFGIHGIPKVRLLVGLRLQGTFVGAAGSTASDVRSQSRNPHHSCGISVLLRRADVEPQTRSIVSTRLEMRSRRPQSASYSSRLRTHASRALYRFRDTKVPLER